MSDRHLRRIDRALLEFYEAIDQVNGVDCEQIPDLFFPEDYSPQFMEAWGLPEQPNWHDQQKLVKMAKDICNDCPLKLRCLSVAIVGRYEYGIWGGLTANERRKLWVYSSPSTTPFSD